MKLFVAPHLSAGLAAAARLAMVALALAVAPTAHADDAARCENPSWAPQPMPGFAIDSCGKKVWASGSYELATDTRVLEGARSSIDYTLKDQGRNPSADAARDYFIAAGKKAGATLMSDPDAPWEATLKQVTPEGEFWYHYQHGSGSDSETDSYTMTT
jgi:hypothetical protein